MNEAEAVQHVTKRAWCSKCKVLGQNTFRIVFVGGSGEVMLGACHKTNAGNSSEAYRDCTGDI